MSFLLHENAGGAGGRRRVSQTSNDEWRAALQQQIDEKKQRDEQQKRYRRYEDDSDPAANYRTNSYPSERGDSADSNNHDADTHARESHSTVADPSLRPGRRGVQQMSNEAWREALEQQIREKKEREVQAQNQSDAARRRSQSAPRPSQSEIDNEFPELPQVQERAMTTPAVNEAHPALGRRRAGVQSDEEQARRLQEQLEVQKVRRPVR